MVAKTLVQCAPLVLVAKTPAVAKKPTALLRNVQTGRLRGAWSAVEILLPHLSLAGLQALARRSLLILQQGPSRQVHRRLRRSQRDLPHSLQAVQDRGRLAILHGQGLQLQVFLARHRWQEPPCLGHRLHRIFQAIVLRGLGVLGLCLAGLHLLHTLHRVGHLEVVRHWD